LNTADDLGADGFDIFYGFGRVNARRAVSKSLGLVESLVVEAPAGSVYFACVEPSVSSNAGAAYDGVAAGVVYGLAESMQWQGFVGRASWLLEDGRVNSSVISDSVVVFAGGPCVQPSVDYYEGAGFTLVQFWHNISHFGFVDETSRLVGALSRETVASGAEDLFVAEIFEDGKNVILVVYGFSWRGTWAGGVFLKGAACDGLNEFGEACYVCHWVDDGVLDGVPQFGEISLLYTAS
jgi:hypothetical protein